MVAACSKQFLDVNVHEMRVAALTAQEDVWMQQCVEVVLPLYNRLLEQFKAVEEAQAALAQKRAEVHAAAAELMAEAVQGAGDDMKRVLEGKGPIAGRRAGRVEVAHKDAESSVRQLYDSLGEVEADFRRRVSDACTTQALIMGGVPMDQMQAQDGRPAEAAASEAGKGLRYFSCSQVHCPGLLRTSQPQPECPACQLKHCTKCFDTLGPFGHVCLPTSLATAAALRSGTRNCPKCRAAISRTYGCNQMMCTRPTCQCIFDWASGEVLKSGPIHNPYFFHLSAETRARMQAAHDAGAPQGEGGVCRPAWATIRLQESLTKAITSCRKRAGGLADTHDTLTLEEYEFLCNLAYLANDMDTVQRRKLEDAVHRAETALETTYAGRRLARALGHRPHVLVYMNAPSLPRELLYTVYKSAQSPEPWEKTLSHVLRTDTIANKARARLEALNGFLAVVEGAMTVLGSGPLLRSERLEVLRSVHRAHLSLVAKPPSPKRPAEGEAEGAGPSAPPKKAKGKEKAVHPAPQAGEAYVAPLRPNAKGKGKQKVEVVDLTEEEDWPVLSESD